MLFQQPFLVVASVHFFTIFVNTVFGNVFSRVVTWNKKVTNDYDSNVDFLKIMFAVQQMYT